MASLWMLKALVATLLVSSSVGIVAASDVIDATASTFDKIVLKSQLPVLVEFYAPYVRRATILRIKAMTSRSLFSFSCPLRCVYSRCTLMDRWI
jgi:hypothetical protein